MEVLKKGFQYSVDLISVIDAEEYKSLTCLYQPLIGSKAMSLFLTLIQEQTITSKLKDEGLDEERLFNLTQMNHKEILSSLDILNAFNLIKVYLKKDGSQLVKFQVLAPLKKKDFFNNDYLNNLLEKTLGEQNYEITKFMLKDTDNINKEEFEEINVDITDLVDHTLISDLSKQKPNFKNVSSYCDKLKQVLDLNYIEKELLKDEILVNFCSEEFAKIFADILIIKKLNEQEMINLIQTSYDLKKQAVNLNLLEKNLTKLITKKTNKTAKNSKSLTKKDLEILKFIESMHWNDYCKIKYQLDLKDWTNAIEQIKTIYRFNDGIINCLIDFSYKKNNGHIVVKYIQKIAKTMYERNINTTQKTMLYLKKIKNAYNNSTILSTAMLNPLDQNQVIESSSTIFEELEALL
ncbi:DnaD domain protein [Mycoplasma putrefaciens]|uniref:Replication initiation and membrane attachment family protein n=2 Tax=Mycoplasma putrefaciens TaxID=2123 RepID=A0A7U4E9J2_MYCPK|nr:DnaD domain protein [Mycoplasma putrefaciens]AEM68594.1 replication initiation and membrane attachment family protein [Mycoplasma putrefaciens KS1]